MERDYLGYCWKTNTSKFEVMSTGPYKIQPNGDKLKQWIVCRYECQHRFAVPTTYITQKRDLRCPICFEQNKVKIGAMFGRLLVIASAPSRMVKDPRGNYKQRIWLCRCTCPANVELEVPENSLKTGHTTSCGCYHKDKISVDLHGKVFGRLLAFDRVRLANRNGWFWICYCDPKLGGCGKISHPISPTDLLRGQTTSCGCKHLERVTRQLSEKVGALNSNWKGGISPLHSKVRSLSAYKEWEYFCFRRDNYTCQYSGKRGGELSVHHIKPFAQILKDNNITTVAEAKQCKDLWDVNNGITLSRCWHLQGGEYEEKSFHNVYGKESSMEEFNEWFALRPIA